MKKTLSSINDRWELLPSAFINIIKTYPRHKTIPKLVYKRKYDNENQKYEFPESIGINSLFNSTLSFVPRILHNYKLLADEQNIHPLSFRTYFSESRSKCYGKSFIEFVFDSQFNSLNPELLSRPYRDPSRMLPELKCLQVRYIDKKEIVKCVNIYNREIVGYVINSIRKVYSYYHGNLYMIMEKGTWLSEKEEKKRMILFDTAGFFRKEIYHKT